MDEPLAVVVRHARTAWNVQGRFLGRTDLPLDDVGLQQAQGLRRFAGRFDVLLTSPLSRARQTASALEPPGAEVEPRLAELDQGLLEGQLAADAAARWPEFFAAFADDPGTARVPGGETLVEVRDRMLEVLSGFVDLAPGAIVGIVSHQLAIASVVATLAGESPSTWRSWRLDHCEGFVLRRKDRTWEVAGRLGACEMPP